MNTCVNFTWKLKGPRKDLQLSYNQFAHSVTGHMWISPTISKVKNSGSQSAKSNKRPENVNYNYHSQRD